MIAGDHDDRTDDDHNDDDRNDDDRSDHKDLDDLYSFND